MRHALTSLAATCLTAVACGARSGLGVLDGGASTGGAPFEATPCPVETCALPKCPPVALAAEGMPRWVGLLGGTVFYNLDGPTAWLQNSGVYRIGEEGAGKQALWIGYSSTGNAGLDAEAVYLGVDQALVPNLLRIPTAGGPPKMLATFAAGDTPLSTLVSGTDLYYTAMEAGGVAIHRVGIDGSGAQVLASGLGGVTGTNSQPLAVDETFVYSVTGPPKPRIVRVPRGGGPLEIVAETMSFHDIVIDADYVYQSGAAETLGIHRYLKTGGAGEIVVPGVEAEHLTLFDGYIYFKAGVPDTIARAPRTGGPAQVLVTGVSPTSLAVDATGIYYGDEPPAILCRLPF